MSGGVEMAALPVATTARLIDGATLLRWEACRFPERRPDAFTSFELACNGCRIALQVAISVPPPPGEFDGFFRERDTAIALLAKHGITIAPH